MARARALQAGEIEPVTPRPACTVLLVRDSDEGLQTFLMRRASTMEFAPRMHVYPGGRVDDVDYAAAVEFGIDDAERARLAERATWPAGAVQALWACAVREVREEVGLDIAPVDAQGRQHIDLDRLPLIAHMITPEVEERRYSVRFFAHVVDDVEQVQLSTTEAVDGFWITPQQALAQHEAGQMAMLTPTVIRLRELAQHDTAQDYLVAASAFAVRPLLPRAVVADDGSVEWLVLDAVTGEVLDQEHAGPATLEFNGQPLHVDLP